jgi:HD-GYP domain-containing protein (c-di-GMP phosphodiesterase class II)
VTPPSGAPRTETRRTTRFSRDTQRFASVVQATQAAELGFTGEESGPSQKAGRNERAVVYYLSKMIKLSRMHASNNPLIGDSVRTFNNALMTLLGRRDSVAIINREMRLHVNGASMRVRSNLTWQQFLVDFLKSKDVAGIVFKGKWDEAATTRFLECLKLPSTDQIVDAASQIPEPAWVNLMNDEEADLYVSEDDDDKLSDTERAAFYYARLIALAEASNVAVANNEGPDFHVRHVRHTFMKILEYLRAGLFEVRLLGMTAQARTTADLVAPHAANVAALSLCMGRLLALPRGVLADLGFAAFYHDLGRAGTAWGARADGKPDALHVARGVSYALRGRGFGSAGLLRLVVGAEHHRRSDKHPESLPLPDGKPHLFSRVIGVADAFDKLEQAGCSPAAALRALRTVKDRVEPALVTLLTDVLGRTPRGTLLKQKDGSTVVVIDGGARREHRPVVRKLLNADGQKDDRQPLQELAATELGTELEPKAVADTLDWRGAIVA